MGYYLKEEFPLKTLKKTLALMLVVAMMFSFGVIGASAAFDDAKDVNADYAEAVEVMSDLGIIKGLTDTTFGPDSTLTRAQACMFIARITLGTDTAAKLTASSKSFTDVAADYWGYDVIEYCYNAGLIAGYGDGKFGPDDALSSYAFAKMLMAALGVDVSACTGANWQIETAKLFIKTGFSSLVLTAGDFTREVAAQMIYGALFYASDATEGYGVYKNGTLVAYYESAGEAATQAALLDALDSVTANVYTNDTSAVTIKSGATLAKTVFGVTRTSGYDATYGRPGNTYKCSTKAQGTAYGWTNKTKDIAAVPVVTFTAYTKESALFAALGVTGSKDSTGYYVTMTSVWTDGVEDSTGLRVDKTAANPVSGNGVLAEVYATSTENEYILVLVKSYFDKVSKVTAATSLVDRFITISGNNFTTEDFAKGDFVIYTMDNGDIASVVDAAVMTGKMSAYTSAGVYTIDENTYQRNAGFTTDLSGNVGLTKVYFLDAYGYIIYADDVSSSGNYFYVISAGDAYVTVDGYLTPVYTAKVVNTEGSVSTVTTTNTSLDVGLYTYTLNSDGTYMLADVSGQGVTGVTKGSYVLAGATATANAATDFVYVDWNSAGTKVTGTVTVKTGIANVTTATGMTAAYVDANTDGIAEVVFVYNDGTATANTADFVYYLGTYGYNSATKLTSYDVIINGAVTTMTSAEANFSDKVAGMYDVASDKTVSASTAVSTADEIAVVTSGVVYTIDASDALTSVAPVANSVPVYTISASGKTADTTDAVDFTVETEFSTMYIAYNSSSVVTAIYLVVA